MSDIYLSLTESPTVVTLSQPVVSGVLSSNVTVTNVVSVNVVTMPAINVTAAAPSVTTVAGTVAVSNFPTVTTVAGTVALDANSLSALENVTVTVGAAVSVSNFPSTQTIAGTVTAGNLPVITDGEGDSISKGVPIAFYDGSFDIRKVVGDGQPLPVEINPTGTIPQISGTVTANVFGYDSQNQENLPIGLISYGSGVGLRGITEVIGPDGSPLPISGTVTANLDSNNFNGALTSYVEAVSSHNAFPVEIAYQPSVTIGSLPAISGTVTANLFGYNPVNDANESFQILEIADQASAQRALPIMAVGSLPAISGTVTAAAPNGSLTTRFGTPTTANVSFATSAVTNANRKYLLIQNVTTGSNVITVGIGFTPTTTQGIQLTAGAGITFESSYIPTGQIFVLSSVTASNFAILEA